MSFKQNMMRMVMLTFVWLIVSCETKKEGILFSSDRNGNSDVFLMTSDGSELRTLTTSKLEEWSPVWIDKKTISFLRQDGDQIERIRLNMETGTEETIPNPTVCKLDDKNALFRNDLELYSCRNDIFLFEAGETRNLTEGITGSSVYPSWVSEDEILFTNNRLGNNDILLLNIIDLSITELVTWDSNDERGDLSPDGRYLAFSSDKLEKGNQEILILDLETNEYRNISKSQGFDLIARWSQDGTRLYFGGNGSGNWEIYAYDISSQQTINLTKNTAFDGDPRPFKD